MSRRVVLSVACAVVAGAGVACRSSTAPDVSLELARHFDYLARVALKLNSPGGNNRVGVLTLLEAAAAFGETPIPVTVTTDSGTQVWQAMALREVSETGFYDTVDFVLLYSDTGVTNALVIRGARFSNVGPLYNVSGLFADTIQVAASSGSPSTNFTIGSGYCATPPKSGLTNSSYVSLVVSDQVNECYVSAGSVSLENGTFSPTAGVSGALTRLSVPSTNFIFASTLFGGFD